MQGLSARNCYGNCRRARSTCAIRSSGFVLRVRPSGKHSYFANYARGKWQLLGTTDKLDPAEAREAARRCSAASGRATIRRRAKRAEARADHIQDVRHRALRTLGDGAAEDGRRADRPAACRVRRHARRAGARRDHPFHVERWRSARLKAGIAASTVNRDLDMCSVARCRGRSSGSLLPAHPLADVKPSEVDRAGTVRYPHPLKKSGYGPRWRPETTNGERSANGRTCGDASGTTPSGQPTARIRTI